MSTDERVLRIAENIRTQDNRITAHPIFVVQQRRRLYGMDPSYVDDVVWLHSDESYEVSEEDAKRLEAAYRKSRSEPDGYTRTAYVDSWEFVTACFTEQGCKDYIASNGHNLKEPRIYAESGFRNREWQVLREFLAALEKTP